MPPLPVSGLPIQNGTKSRANHLYNGYSVFPQNILNLGQILIHVSNVVCATKFKLPLLLQGTVPQTILKPFCFEIKPDIHCMCFGNFSLMFVSETSFS